MRTAKRRRFERVEQVVSRLPYCVEVLEDAFALFRLSGELYEEQRLAAEVTRLALLGCRAGKDDSALDPQTLIMRALYPAVTITVVTPNTKPQQPTVRECLFNEAVYGPDYVRCPARLALRYLVGMGGDVCDPAFGADKGFPKHASMGWHVLGFPERLATPPYEKQARRLFAQLDDYRARVSDDSEAFLDRLADATVALLWNGELPHDPFLREGTILQAEFSCLWEHKRGKDVAAVMAAFDAVARAKGNEREVAVRRLQEALRGTGGT